MMFSNWLFSNRLDLFPILDIFKLIDASWIFPSVRQIVIQYLAMMKPLSNWTFSREIGPIFDVIGPFMLRILVEPFYDQRSILDLFYSEVHAGLFRNKGPHWTLY